MISVKGLINSALAHIGYQVIRRPTLAREIAQGKYRWLQDMGIATVLDIGANIGQFAEQIRQVLPQATIYSFEPLEECYRALSSKAVQLAPMRCYRFALGKETATTLFHHNEASPSSSILPMAEKHTAAFPFTGNTVEEVVEVRSLDDVAPELQLHSKVLAKIDVQGFERSVLEGSTKTLPMIDVLILETSFVELYKGQSLFHEMYQFLHSREFVYAGSFGQLPDPRNGMILQEDSIFLNGRSL